MSHRFQIVLADPAAAQLHELAAATGEPASTIAAQLIRRGLAHAATDGAVRSPTTSAPPNARPRAGAAGGGRARWLEPYGGDPAWRGAMWAQILALHGRYPRQLAHLKDAWWEDDAHIETLCALAVWRAELDDNGLDPREELAFQHQLADYAQSLRQEGGGIGKAWKPGAPPSEWTA